jgi:hypothetical protein
VNKLIQLSIISAFAAMLGVVTQNINNNSIKSLLPVALSLLSSGAFVTNETLKKTDLS